MIDTKTFLHHVADKFGQSHGIDNPHALNGLVIVDHLRHLAETVSWQPIATVPENQRVLVRRGGTVHVATLRSLRRIKVWEVEVFSLTGTLPPLQSKMQDWEEWMPLPETP